MNKACKSVTYEVDIKEGVFMADVDIVAHQERDIWSFYNGDPGMPGSESKDYEIRRIVDYDADGTEVIVKSDHPAYTSILSKIDALVWNEEMDYD